MASAKRLLRVLRGERLDPPPVWFMRQAGRYLPEYRSLRAAKGGFLDLVYDSTSAAEITLQPLRRFRFEGAILFSDILVVPYALGQDLRFAEGEGPRLSPPLLDAGIEGLTPRLDRLQPIYQTVRAVAAALPPETAFLGFAGSPWTVATYMVAGAGSRDQVMARSLAYRDAGGFGAMMERLIDVTSDYLAGQIEAGVEAVQLFDSWAGSLAPDQFDRWVIEPTRAIVARLKERFPSVPVIGFPKGAGGRLEKFARETGVDAVGLDETVDPAWADAVLPAGMPVQGNLDPLLLLSGGEALRTSIASIKHALRHRPHIFNLGHGIDKDTPTAHVEAALAEIRRPG